MEGIRELIGSMVGVANYVRYGIAILMIGGLLLLLIGYVLLVKSRQSTFS